MQLHDHADSPSLDEPDTDRLLRALADATRRTLLDRLRDRAGLTLGELSAGFTLTRQALSKHLAVLEAAQLVVAVWRGREKLHYLNPLPLQRLPARWVTTTARETGAALAALKQALKPAAMQGRDDVAAAFAAEPGAALAGTRIVDADALAQARHYLAGSVDAMQRLIERLPSDAGYTRPAGGGFSLAEQVWHLADLDEFGWVPRLERLLAERRPRLPGVDGDRLAIERCYQQRPWRGAARRFIAQRRRALRSLGRFDAELLRRPAVFAGRTTTAGDVLAAMVAHDREHRLEIASLWTQEKAR
jgi:DNA-binding transcriptional ArsR family regulator